MFIIILKRKDKIGVPCGTITKLTFFSLFPIYRVIISKICSKYARFTVGGPNAFDPTLMNIGIKETVQHISFLLHRWNLNMEHFCRNHQALIPYSCC